VDRRVEFQGVAFIWSTEKADRNLRQHGISFDEATEAFFDPFVKVVDATRKSEPRDAVLGMARHFRLLFVVHVEAEDEAFRIISARKATPEEWKLNED
jgi:uncharacterized DUF497 family protein